MTTSESLAAATAQWRSAADDLLADVGVLGSPADRVETFVDASDALCAEIAARADTDSAAAAGALPVLLAAMEVGNALLADRTAVRALDDRSRLDEFEAAIMGAASPAAALPADLVDRLETLEMAGARELVALGQDTVLHRALGNMAAGLGVVGGDRVRDAFAWVSQNVDVLRRSAVRVLLWVVDKVRALVPDSFQGKVDAVVAKVADAARGSVDDVAGDVLGHLLGRREAQRGWQSALDGGRDLTAATAELPAVISGHLKRIGYVTTGRQAAAGAAAVVGAILSFTNPHVQIVIGALVIALVAFVCCQVWDGFNDIERLARG